MAKAEKYRYNFKTLEGQNCVVRFNFEGFTGASTTLIGADKPFTLGEFNTDENLFKPVRPQLATMNILASASGVSIDDFLMNNDTDVDVYFDFGTWGNYWIGYLQQDDFQETWTETNHIITLRASEGIGLLSNKMWSYYGAEPSEKYNFLEGLQSAMNGTIQSFANYYVFSSLYHESMPDYGNATTGIDQCIFDGKTFMTDPQIYENSYEVLSKLNEAWNQNVFMYKGYWNIMRVSDQFVSPTTNIDGYAESLGLRTNISKRFDILVGNGQDVQLIMPEPMRFINRRNKYEKTTFEFDDFVEIIPNQTFSRGDLLSSTSTLKTYEINDWTYEQGGSSYPSFSSPSTPSGSSLIREEKYDSQYSVLADTYAVFPVPNTNAYRWMRSTQINVKAGEKISLSFDAKYDVAPTDDGNYPIGCVLFYGLGFKYQLSEDGKWVLNNATWTSTNSQFIKINIGSGSAALTAIDWNTFSVDSLELPYDGYIQIALITDYRCYETNQRVNFRNVKFNVISKFNTNLGGQLQAIESKYTSTDDLRNAFDSTMYFQDGFSYHYKGSIFESNGTTLTDKQWFRKAYPAERFSFARQYLTSIWQNLVFNRNKLDVSFYGLTWDEGNEPIGLINTVRFIDDDPEKVYGILNLKEIDFANSTWTATLLEIWDNDKDIVNEQKTLSATNKNVITLNLIKFNAISNTDFQLNSENTIEYIATNTITVNITCTVVGTLNAINSTPFDIDFNLLKNNVPIKTVTVTMSTDPQSVNVNLGINSISLSTGDELKVQMDTSDASLTVSGGGLSFNYTKTAPPSFDSFTEQYIFE